MCARTVKEQGSGDTNPPAYIEVLLKMLATLCPSVFQAFYVLHCRGMCNAWDIIHI